VYAYRGFQENSDKIQINTDYRSHKVEDLKHCSFAEVINFHVFSLDKYIALLDIFIILTWLFMIQICWYFTDSWEQFRINGVVDVIDGSNPDPMKVQAGKVYN
jgi:hypothetical protein